MFLDVLRLVADGRTTLHGMIQFPSNFDPSKKYPALASVYGGPASAASHETFAPPSALAEYGFLLLTLDSRAVPGQGKRTLDQIYLKLGQVEMDDMAEGVKALWNRPYFDRNRVGIYGTSYGGYSSWCLITRCPPAVVAAAAPICGMTDLVVDYETTRPDLRPYSEEMLGGPDSGR